MEELDEEGGRLQHQLDAMKEKLFKERRWFSKKEKKIIFRVFFLHQVVVLCQCKHQISDKKNQRMAMKRVVIDLSSIPGYERLSVRAVSGQILEDRIEI